MGIPGGFGSILITGLISAMLYGITTLQTYVYYMHYSEDASTMKFLVAATWILDTLHFSSMCHMLYYYLITNYGVPTSLEYIVWSFPVSVLVNLLVILAVQLFFAHKIHYLYRPQVRWWVTTPIILFVLAHFGFGIEMVVLMSVDNKMSILTQTWYYGVTPSVATVALAEILITVSLCVLLYDNGLRSTVPRTKRLLNTLIIYAVNRCLLTLLVAIAELTVNIDQQSAWTMGLNFIMGKLYANSLLASLNSRQYLRSRDSTVPNANISTIHFVNLPNPSENVGSCMDGGTEFDVRGVAVIDTTTERAFDKTTTVRRGAV